MFFDTETPEQNFSHVIMDPSEGIQVQFVVIYFSNLKISK